MKLDREKLEKELWEDLASALDPDPPKSPDLHKSDKGDQKWKHEKHEEE